MVNISYLCGAFTDWIGDFVSALLAVIPKTFYFLTTCCASAIDFTQLVFRKAVGLDVYYVDGIAQEGDIVYEFIYGTLISGKYAALQATFWSLAVLGIILLFLSTIIAVIQANYFPGGEFPPSTAKSLKKASMSAINMLVYPVAALLGIYLCNILLQAVDSATSVTNESAVMYRSEPFKQNEKGSYSYYDVFSFGFPTTTQTLSGLIFVSSAYSANRARNGDHSLLDDIKEPYSGSTATDAIFYTAGMTQDQCADLIDAAFAGNFHLKDSYKGMMPFNSADTVVQVFLKTDPFYYLTLVPIGSFSKYNVQLVWTYYNLWQYNFIIAIALIYFTIKTLVHICFGAIKRFFVLIILFFTFIPLAGLTPLYDKPIKEAKSNFIKYTIMCFGSVFGLNVFFLLLPYINEIKMFDPSGGGGLLNALAVCIIANAGISSVETLIKMLDSMMGSADMTGEGKATAAASGEMLGKAIKGAVAVGSIAGGPMAMAAKGALGAIAKNKAGTAEHMEQTIQDTALSQAKTAGGVGDATARGFATGTVATGQAARKVNNYIDRQYANYTSGGGTGTREQFLQERQDLNKMTEQAAVYDDSRSSASQRQAAGESIGTTMYRNQHEDTLERNYRTTYASDIANVARRKSKNTARTNAVKKAMNAVYKVASSTPVVAGGTENSFMGSLMNTIFKKPDNDK